MSHVLTNQLVAEMAPNDKALVDGRGVVKKGGLKKLAKSEDGTLIFGFCQGSGKQPYEVSIDLAAGGDRPTVRCSCPSRQFPCKHGLALMLAFVANGAAFPVQAPPAALLEKRARMTERAEKQAKEPAAAAPRKVDKAAQAKKTQEQRDALDTLETFMTDLVGAGLGGLTGKSIKAIDTQAKRMADADMRRAAATLQRLSALVSADEDDDEDDEDEKKAARGLSAERQAQIASLVTQLWVTVRKGRKALEGKMEEGATQGEADAQVESILGRAWKLPELKEAGYWVTDRSLIELAHERSEDPVIEMTSASGYLLDLGDGSVVEEQTSLPFAALKFGAKLRNSRLGVLSVKEAALYPGDVVNRRIRWDEKQVDGVSERPRGEADHAAIHGHAKPLDPLIKLLRNQIKNPLNPSSAVVLLSVARFGLSGDTVVAVDSTGARLAIRDPRKAPFKTSLNLRTAAGAFGPQAGGAGKPCSLAVRLFLDPIERAVLGQALALFAGDKHLRLGM
jgi:uncharacterized Zn finger protein